MERCSKCCSTNILWAGIGFGGLALLGVSLIATIWPKQMAPTHPIRITRNIGIGGLAGGTLMVLFSGFLLLKPSRQKSKESSTPPEPIVTSKISSDRVNYGDKQIIIITPKTDLSDKAPTKEEAVASMQEGIQRFKSFRDDLKNKADELDLHIPGDYKERKERARQEMQLTLFERGIALWEAELAEWQDWGRMENYFYYGFDNVLMTAALADKFELHTVGQSSSPLNGWATLHYALTGRFAYDLDGGSFVFKEYITKALELIKRDVNYFIKYLLVDISPNTEEAIAFRCVNGHPVLIGSSEEVGSKEMAFQHWLSVIEKEPLVHCYLTDMILDALSQVYGWRIEIFDNDPYLEGHLYKQIGEDRDHIEVIPDKLFNPEGDKKLLQLHRKPVYGQRYPKYTYDAMIPRDPHK